MNKEVTILMKLTDRASAGFGKISKAFGDSVRNMQTSVAGAKKAISDYVKGMQEGSEKARAFADGLKTIAVASGIVAGAVLLVAKSSLDAAIEMESLKLGLASVAGSAQAANAQMKELREIAKLPGLGLQEAIQGSTRLQAVGINAQLANKALMEFGNALARVGKGREELSGVILALTQIVGAGKVTAEEINQIAERVPEVRKVMMEAFGTASTEAIQKMNLSAESFIATLVSGFEKLPRVIGGSRNEIENFNDAVFNAKVAAGQVLLPVFTQVLGMLTNLVGWFNQLSDTTKSLITWSGVVVGGLAAITASLAGLGLALPALIAGMTVLTTSVIPALGSALSFLATNPIGLTITAIGLLAATLLALRADYNASIITVEKFSSSIGKLNDEMANVGQITGLAKELGELQSKTNLTQTESNRLYEVQAKLAEISPTLIRGYDEQGRALAGSKKEIIDYAAEQYKLLDIEREILVLRAKQRAGELGKQLGKEVGTLESLNKQLGDVGRQEYTVQTRFGEMSTRSRTRFISGMAEQAEKVRGLRQEYNALMGEIEQAEQQRGLRVELPPLPKIDKTIVLEEKEIAKIEKDTLDARQEARDALAKLSGDEIKILEARHLKEIEDIDKRLAAIKGSSTAEVQLRQALNQQKLAVDQVFIGERNKILEEETEKINKAIKKDAEESQKRLNEWVKNRVQASVAATKAEAEYRKQAEREAIVQLQEETKARADYWNDNAAVQQKAEEEARQYHKDTANIKIGITETYFKIQETRTAQHQKRMKELTDLGFEETVKDVMMGWKELTSDATIGTKDDIIDTLAEINRYFGSLEISIGSLKTDIGTLTDAFKELQNVAKSGNITVGEGMAIGKAWEDIWSGIAVNFNKGEQSVRSFNEEYQLLIKTHQGDAESLRKINKIYAQMMTYTAGGLVMPSKENREWWKSMVESASSAESQKRLEKIKEILLMGVDFAEALRPGLESSWNDLWQSLFDPDSVMDPLESFAETLESMIFKQLVDVFATSPELMERARQLGEYIAFALNDGIISQKEKFEIDRYRAWLTKEYQETTEKIMLAVDALDLQIRGVQKDATEDAAKSITQSAEKIVSAGEEFSKTLQSSLGTSWTNLWKSMFDPDAVIKPLEDFANTLDEMIFQQLVAVFTKSPEIIQLAQELGEYIAAAFQDGIVSELEKQRIDEYRKQLVQVYGENTEKLMTAVDMLDLQVRQSRTAQQDAIDWMEFTKVGLLGTQALDDITMRDILMKPQQEYFDQLGAGYPKTTTTATPDAESLMLRGKPPQVSDVVETRPGVTFIQNNQFSGLVNFDNPEAMRELARKLQPYTEELQENWVSG
jgi:tape measure domain-containing protein